MLTLGSLFDGIGGFPLAGERCGIKALWASEIEKNCVSITRRHFPKMKHLGDLTGVHGGDIPPVDIISFGSPCQGMSVAGKRQGLQDERSNLFFEAVRIIYEMREATDGEFPKYAIWENVPGSFSGNNGQDFRAVLQEITKTEIPMPKSGRWATAGMVRGGRQCRSLAWRQLDAQFFGVPQRRKRIFLVADFRNEHVAEILFKPESLLGYSKQSQEEREETSSSSGNGAQRTSRDERGHPDTLETSVDFGRTSDRIRINPRTSATIQAGGGGGGAKTGLYLLPKEGKACLSLAPVASTLRANAGAPKHESDILERLAIGVYESNSHGGYKEGCGTLRASGGDYGGGSENLVCQTLPINDANIHGSANGFGIGDDGDPAPTLTGRDRHGVVFYEAYQHHGWREADVAGALTTNQNSHVRGDTPIVSVRYVLRKLTPLECERLQGFPDDWTRYTEDGTEKKDTPRYMAAGNSLAVPCAERVFRGILEVEGKGEKYE